MKLSLITINFNSTGETINLLDSLKNQTDKDFDIYIVDNGSDKKEFLSLKFYIDSGPENFKLIESKENLGFSGGNNLGIKKALNPPTGGGADWIFLLNNDTWVGNEFISELKKSLDGKIGIIGLPLVENDKIAYAGKIEWLRATLKHVYKETRDKRQETRPWSLGAMLLGPYYAVGGAMAVHKSIFEKVDYLDENYFLYFEDADFSIRAKKAGIPVGFSAKPKINHSVSVSSKKIGSPLVLRYHFRNALYFNQKNGPAHIKILVHFWAAGIVFKQLLKILLFINSETSRQIMRGVFDFYSGKMGKIQ